MPLAIEMMNCNAGRLQQWATPGNAWSFWRIWWNGETGARVSHEGKWVSLGPEQLVAAAPQTMVKRELEHPLDHLWLHASLSWPYDRVRPQLVVVPLTKVEQRAVRALRQSLAGQPGDSALNRQMSLGLQHWVLRILSQVEDDDWLPAAQDRRICKVLQTMDQDLESPWSNAELANIACLSPGAFAHRFREEVGEAPQTWLTRRRLQRACLLLHHSDSSIEEVASACGFCNRYYFSRLFSRAYGMGPASWRKCRDLPGR